MIPTIYKDFEDWACSLEKEIGRDEDSLTFFHWALEDEYEARFSEALEYFSMRPDFLAQECKQHLIELNKLETRFVDLEEYEKCAIVRDLALELKRRYSNWI
jgi:hypothetical protein